MVALSVIVPIYNVDRYLRECLHSLSVQSCTEWECVLVDDGSTDDSAAIAKEFAAEDSRFTLVQQPNAGLGAARNTGVNASSGEFLTFVDSDDVIPPYAYGYHLTTLRSTGSDFSSGNVYRLNELGTRQSPMHRRIFGTTALATHITQRDSLLVDRLATNKVWRRSFWERNHLSFPEGVLYEDVSAVIPAHFQARSVDVLARPVYLWRERPSDDTSITMDRTHLAGLEDRFRAVRDTAAFLRHHGTPVDRRRWDVTALSSDLRLFLQVLDRADAKFQQRFLELGNDYLDTVQAEALRELPAIERLKWHLVRRRMLPQLLETLTFNKSVEQHRAGAVRHGTRYYADYPFKDDAATGVPRGIYRLGAELSLRQKCESVTWVAGKLVIRGRACLKYLRPNLRIQQFLRAWAVHPQTGQRVRLSVSQHQANEFRISADIPMARTDWGGYEITVDPRRLTTTGVPLAGDWFVELRVSNRGLVRTRRLTGPQPGAPQRPGPHQFVPGTWLRPSWQGSAGLCLTVDATAARLTGHRCVGDELELTGILGAQLYGIADTLRLVRQPGDTHLDLALSTQADGTFTARARLPELTEGLGRRQTVATAMITTEEWHAWLYASGSDELSTTGTNATDTATPTALARLAFDASTSPGHYRPWEWQYDVEADPAGWLILRVGDAEPVLTGVEWTNDMVTLTGTAPAAAPDQLFLVVKARGRAEEHLVTMECSQGRFLASFRPLAIPGPTQELPLPSGQYRFASRQYFGVNSWRDLPMRARRTVLPELPAAADSDTTAGQQVTIDAHGRDTPVLTIGSRLRAKEQGAYAQQVLRERIYPALRQDPILPDLLFDSYSGKQYSDSPRGICTELRDRGTTRPAHWIVRDGQVHLPDGLTEVRHASREYFEQLARSEFIVCNAHLPMWFERRPGQTVVQTWHGSMLKRIGFDIEHVQFATRDYYERLRHETNQWDYLISPSPWATPILRRAFRFDGEILETGYPRNDIFHRPERDQLAERVRRNLGLPEGKNVVLYAPTWRDDKFYARGKYKLDLHLDLQRMYQGLGSDHVLLVRRHPNIVDRVPIVGENFVYDVSTYPEMQELLLITDVLVTDYSSLMFDFANTGRPMLFFTYDLTEYRDSLRGFYFDFEETAPGPLLQTSDAVIESLRDVGEVHRSHAARYQAFVDQFCPLDDGNAAARVVDRVFGEEV